MLDRSESNTLSRPRLILVHADAAIAARIAGGFRRLDWDVSMARTGPEARWLAGRLRPDAVILHTDLPEESGWLTCDKLTREQPLACVILVSDNLGRRNQQLAFFVGASALIGSGGGMASWIDELVCSLQPRRVHEDQLGTPRWYARQAYPPCAARR